MQLYVWFDPVTSCGATLLISVWVSLSEKMAVAVAPVWCRIPGTVPGTLQTLLGCYLTFSLYIPRAIRPTVVQRNRNRAAVQNPPKEPAVWGTRWGCGLGAVVPEMSPGLRAPCGRCFISTPHPWVSHRGHRHVKAALSLPLVRKNCLPVKHRQSTPTPRSHLQLKQTAHLPPTQISVGSTSRASLY